jgi:hypothetical protein
MNDRIKAMWETAAQRDDLWTQARYEKFAELIVAECIQTIQMGITRDGHNTEQYLRSVKHIKQIREHFGVEE